MIFWEYLIITRMEVVKIIINRSMNISDED